MKKIITLIATLSLFVLLAVAVGAAATQLTHHTIFRISTADPWVISGAAGENPSYFNWYYQTKTGSTRVAVVPTKDIRNYYDGSNGYATDNHIHYDTAGYIDPVTGNTTTDPTVFELFGDGATIDGTWSPEIHYFSEKDFPGHSGWYMYVALRQDYDDTTGESSRIRMVVLKSTGATAGKDYGHPVTGEKNYSQAFLDKDGNILDEWACGQTILRIREGKYAGIYAMWVSEHGRGEEGFYQTISIAKLKSPWQIDGEIGTVTRPTQEWEMSGGPAATTKYPDKVLPHVVEGATPIYGRNGEIFIIYCGSGYWTNGNYALGQLTWNGNDPLLESSWKKLDEDKNPIFDAKRDSNNLAGAGHASFIQDKDGNGFAIYHAYRLDATTGKEIINSGKTKAERYSFIEPYYINYEEGIVHIGLDDDRSPADFRTATVSFNQDQSLAYLTAPTVSAESGREIQLSLSEINDNAEGYTIYRSTDGEVFEHLATTTDTVYTDSDVTFGKTYYYRAYAYREEEISRVSETVSATANVPPAPTVTTTDHTCESLTFVMSGDVEYDSFNIYRGDLINTLTLYATTAESSYTVTDMALDTSYLYKVCGVVNGIEGEPSNILNITLQHMMLNKQGLDATCTTDGYTAYKKCYYCGEESGKEIIPAGHKYEMTEAEVPATLESEGKTAVYTCAGCGDSYGGEVIPKLIAGSGDTNGDKNITTVDVLMVLRAITDDTCEIDLEAADLDGNGRITINDLLILIHKVLTTAV